MYFPFLRGKQNELIALRELNAEGSINNDIIPIIEPVKYSSTLVTTLQSFIDNSNEVVLIVNSQIGSFMDDLNENEEFLETIRQIILSGYITVGYHLYDGASEELIELSQAISIPLEDFCIIHNDINGIETYDEIFNNTSPKYNIVPDTTAYRRRFRNDNGVVLRDVFVKLDRNVDYLDVEDEHFSSEHLYYEEEGYIGFSDYSIVGDNFTEGGFGAKAVAIHLVYVADNSELRIRHFVSDSNETRTDQAGKFGEALQKLVDWYAQNEDKLILTQGLSGLLAYQESGDFPGLGIVKKLGIKNHIELIENLLETSNI